MSLLSLLAAAASLLVPVASAAAGSGASGLGAGGGTASPSGTTTAPGSPTPVSSSNGTTNPAGAGTLPTVTPLTGTQQVSGDGITLTVAQFGELGHGLTVSGEAPPTDAGATIDLQGTSPANGSTWSVLASATVQADGSFHTVWIPATSARFTLQATLSPGLNQSQSPGAAQTGGGGLPDAQDTALSLTGTQTFTLPVFKLSIATFYGPGFWGQKTACGQVLRRNTLGVANRTLPCGTMVAVYFKGRELSVPVIDRGPYANRASWDLTYAVARALHITQTVQVGTLAAAPASSAAPTPGPTPGPSAAVRRGR